MKKTMCLLLTMLMALSLCVPGFASTSGEPTVGQGNLICPTAYLDDDGAFTENVVNGYYAETAPILLNVGGILDTEAAVKQGYVVAEIAVEDIASAVQTLHENNSRLAGDSNQIVLIASGSEAAAAAEYALDGNIYAAVLYNPAVAGAAEEAALKEAYEAALNHYLLSNYQSSRQDGPNIVYTIDAEGAAAYCEANAADFTVDYETLDVALAKAPTVDGSAGETVITPDDGITTEYFYIRGTADDAAVASAALALGSELKAAGSVVNCAVSWEQEEETTLFDWLERICKFEVTYTPEQIETILDLSNGIAGGQYSWKAGDTVYTLSKVIAVANPELADYQGLSVSVPSAYVKGLDEDGNLIIDWDAEITTPNGAVYTAATAPIVINTGAAGYSSSTTGNAGSSYASYGYINVACGNRGKNNVCTDAEGNTYYTGDAPYCLVGPEGHRSLAEIQHRSR